MKKWEFLRIGDVFIVTSGGTPLRERSDYYINGKIPWIKTGDLKGKYVNNPDEFITEEALKNSSAKLFPANTVLLAMYGATIGACSILPFQAATNQACAALLPSKKSNEIYLYYFIKSIVSELTGMGVGGAQPNISVGKIKQIQIPLPPLPTQQKIATILDAAEAYRQKTKVLIEKYEQLAQSLFNEMFGDPVTNPKGWKVILLGEISKDMKYGTNCKSDEIQIEGSTAIIRIPNIQPGYIDYNDLKYSKLSEGELKKVKLKKGDLLFVRSNGNPEYIGRCAYFNSDKITSAYASYIIRVRLLNYEVVIPQFLSFLFNYKSYRNRVVREARTTAGNYNLNTQGLKGFEIIIPPITLQNQFADRIQLIEAKKQQARATLQKADELFNCLLQRAFKGELVE